MVRDREAWRAAVRGVAELDMTGQVSKNNTNSKAHTDAKHLKQSGAKVLNNF